MTDDGILNRERYFDPWNDMNDEEMLFFFENDEDAKEDQKARLNLYIAQCKHNKKFYEKQNKGCLKGLSKYGVTNKENVRFLSESTFYGKEAITEKEKEF